MSSEPKAGVVSGWRKVWSARAERYSKLRAGRLYLDRGSQSVSGELPENHFDRVTARLQWVEQKEIKTENLEFTILSSCLVIKGRRWRRVTWKCGVAKMCF